MNSSQLNEHKQSPHDYNFEIIPILQKFLNDAGIDEQGIHTDLFKRFMHSTLLELAYCHTSSTMFKLNEMNDDGERETYKTLITMNSDYLAHNKKDFNDAFDDKIEEAMSLCRDQLPQHIKDHMKSIGYNDSEIVESHESYSSFVSMLVITETKKLVQITSNIETYSIANANLQSNVARSSSSLEYLERITSYISTITSRDKHVTLLTSTKKHALFHVNNMQLSPNCSVLIKALKENNAKNVKSLENEMLIGQTMHHPSFRSSLLSTRFENKPAIVLEFIPIVTTIDQSIFTTQEFLAVAREILTSLHHMHSNHIMHLNLTSDHILYDKSTKTIKIIGYGSCTNFDSKRGLWSNQELFDKDLRYISPEQTNKMNDAKDIDYRSDFYSLGIIFYKLLTRRFPFEEACDSNSNKSMSNLIHLHIFQEPTPVCQINASVPEILSDLVSKLLSKSPDDRYQSCKGIIYDIDLIISEYSETIKATTFLSSSSSIPLKCEFRLAEHDMPDIFLIPQKLFGRTNEYDLLLSTFESVTPQTSKVVFISGDSGSGKSALASNLYKPIIKKGSIFIRGKYDSSTSRPYSALLETFKVFCDDLLTKDESAITYYKQQIQEAVSDEGRILTDIIDNLDLIIGTQPIISDNCYGQEAKSRFIFVFKKFIRALCTGPSITLLLDDLQWIDECELELLSAILTDKSITNFMFIGTYRANEVDESHSLTKLLEKLKDITEIKLENLDHEALNELISTCFHTSPYQTYPFTAYLHDNTDGNPFSVHITLKALYEKGIIFFCNDKCQWTWDVTIYNDCGNNAENVLTLIKNKIESFDERTQQALKVASCIGASFSLSILQLVVNSRQAIDDAISTGLIIPYKGSDHVFCFLHDEIQHAAYSLLPEDSKRIFFYMGKKLFAVSLES